MYMKTFEKIMSNKIDSCKHLAETERKTGVFIKSKTIAAVL